MVKYQEKIPYEKQGNDRMQGLRGIDEVLLYKP